MTEARVIWQITGADRFRFLQGLITNDMLPLEKAPGILWAAILTPQGKYLADFFVIRQPDDALLIDIAAGVAEATLRRLTMYRLRANVAIAPVASTVTRGLGDAPSGAWPDPRHPALGWRFYGKAMPAAAVDWTALRVAHCIPETGIELIPDESYPLEVGFERLNGVDFRKGCYVGQEVTARMKHKTVLRKGLVTLDISGTAPVGTTIRAGDKEAGTVLTSSGARAIAYLRFDRATGPMQAGDAVVTWDSTSGPL
jgi:folate-binding protein YgfZ